MEPFNQTGDVNEMKELYGQVNDICRIHREMCDCTIDPADPAKLNFRICNMNLYAHRLEAYIKRIQQQTYQLLDVADY